MKKQENAIGKTKICSICNQEKSLENFWSSKTGKFNKESNCIPCKKEKYEIKKSKFDGVVKTPPKSKTCTVCKIEKSISYFCKSNIEVDGFYYVCSICSKEKNEKYKNKIFPSNDIQKRKEYRSKYNSKPDVILKRKEYNKIKNTQKRKEKSIIEKLKPIISKKEKSREKYKKCPQTRLRKIIRSRIYKLLKYNKNHKNSTYLLGCTWGEFKQYLELSFLPEMTWENHGEIWEIDHILSCFNFDLTIEEEQLKCFHYTNMRPLFKTTEIAQSFGYSNIIGNRNRNKK